ncbi:MAG: DUF4175 domain-containing protein [Rhodobacteraceae bacterium]|nr:DUF4175 domain-containing protein [Paracoccaceae bacterium]
MTDKYRLPLDAEKQVRWPLKLTLWGMLAERLFRCFWPAASILMAAAAALIFGAHDLVPIEVVWGVAVVALLGLVVTLALGIKRFHMPQLPEALDRLDRTLPGRPLTAVMDEQAIGAGDAASELVWKAHVARMAARLSQARAVEPDLRLSERDPYALRYVALIALVMALIFGSFGRVASVTDLAPGMGGEALAGGPSWEGWIEPPAYTGKPSLYLNDIPAGDFEIPQQSRVTLRLYGEVGALVVAETVSGRAGELPSASEPVQGFDVARPGTLSIDGPGGREWNLAVLPDRMPEIAFEGEIERGLSGEMRQGFRASDDYGIVAGWLRIDLDGDVLDRRYGLAAEPETREALVLDLPLTISGNRGDFSEILIENLSKHAWAGLPVILTLEAEDALGQIGASEARQEILPGRRFFDPLARAIVEQRRDLLWSRENAPRVSQVLRAVSYRPDDVFRSESAYLQLRVAIRRLEDGYSEGLLSEERRDEIAEALWEIALLIEDGRLSDALERLRRAQERLADAIRNGATDEEIAELMQEMREAMQDYMRQLAEQAQQDGQQQAENQQGQEITGDQLEQMLQRLQELMEQGRMAEAQQLLDQLRQMMENMQVTQGQGQGQQSPGQQAMEGLAETLRDQQGLNDETFGDLQNQFGQGEQGQQDGQGLADRQQALRDELNRQRQGLPGGGTPEGDAAREALERAERAMEGAEEALRDDDLAGALDDQSEALEALREGMRNLGEALAQEQGQQQGQQGDSVGQANGDDRRDPLGRDAGSNGRIGTDEDLLQGEDVYRRARELLDEIRRRSGEQERPEQELEYLKRLLDRF